MKKLLLAFAMVCASFSVSAQVVIENGGWGGGYMNAYPGVPGFAPQTIDTAPMYKAPPSEQQLYPDLNQPQIVPQQIQQSYPGSPPVVNPSPAQSATPIQPNVAPYPAIDTAPTYQSPPSEQQLYPTSSLPPQVLGQNGKDPAGSFLTNKIPPPPADFNFEVIDNCKWERTITWNPKYVINWNLSAVEIPWPPLSPSGNLNIKLFATHQGNQFKLPAAFLNPQGGTYVYTRLWPIKFKPVDKSGYPLGTYIIPKSTCAGQPVQLMYKN